MTRIVSVGCSHSVGCEMDGPDVSYHPSYNTRSAPARVAQKLGYQFVPASRDLI